MRFGLFIRTVSLSVSAICLLLLTSVCFVEDSLHETSAKNSFSEAPATAIATKSVSFAHSAATHEVNSNASAYASGVPIASAINLSKQRINELYSLTTLEGLCSARSTCFWNALSLASCAASVSVCPLVAHLLDIKYEYDTRTVLVHVLCDCRSNR